MPDPGDERALDELAFTMFKKFARFECALKAANFLLKKADGDEAKPHWDEFAKTVPAIFDNPDDPDLKAAVKYILDSPPKKQIVKDGFLAWDEADPVNMPRSQRVLV